MNIPDFSYDKVVDTNGNWTMAWLQVITQLLQQLQENFSEAGLVGPSQSTANIAVIASSVPQDCTFIYDSDTDEVKVWTGGSGGSFKVVQVV